MIEVNGNKKISSDDNTKVYKGIGYIVTLEYGSQEYEVIFNDDNQVGSNSSKLYISSCTVVILGKILFYAWVT